MKEGIIHRQMTSGGFICCHNHPDGDWETGDGRMQLSGSVGLHKNSETGEISEDTECIKCRFKDECAELLNRLPNDTWLDIDVASIDTFKEITLEKIYEAPFYLDDGSGKHYLYTKKI